MTERELIGLWLRARNQLIFAQLAPTFLLITTVGLIDQIRSTGDWAVWATIGILAASGILGALAEFGAADEAQAVAADLGELGKLGPLSAVARRIQRGAPLLYAAKFLTPAIFVAIFIALLFALLG